MKPHSGEETPQQIAVSLAGDIFDRLGQGVIYVDTGFCLRYVNTTASRFLCKQISDLAGQSISVVIPEDLGGKLTEALREAIRGNSDIIFEAYYPAPVYRWFTFNCLPLEDGIVLVIQAVMAVTKKEEALSGKPDQMEAQRISRSAGEIREHPSTQGAPRYSPDLLQAIIDNAPAGLAVTDRSGNMILTNAAIREILGRPVTGTSYEPKGSYQLLTLDGQPIKTNDLPLPRALQNGDTTRDMEILVKRDNGSEAVVLASATPLRGDTGDISGAVTVFQDITEFKLTEKALRESRERLSFAQQAGQMGMLEWDITANRSVLSDEMKAIYGVSPDFGGTMEDWEKITPHEDIREVLGKLDETVARHGNEIESEYRIIRPDGEVRWLSSRGIIHYDGSGKPARVIVVAIDITDLKNAQAAIRRINEELERKVAERTSSIEKATRLLDEQKELLQAIINGIPVIVTLWRPYRKLTMANKEFERLTGWSQEEAMSMDIITTSIPDPVYRREIIRLVTKAEPGWGEFVINTRSGKNLIISWAAVDLTDGSRVGIGIDVTEQRKMEREMLRLATAIDQAGEGILLFNPEWVIEYVNPSYERLSGYTREELIGKDVDFLSSHTLSHFYPEIPRMVSAKGESWRGRIKRKKKSGEILDLYLTMSPVKDNSGKTTNYVSVVQDISQETRLQQMIIQSQKMEAIGTLAGGISHDLKNILTPILINSESALEDVGIDHPAYPLIQEILQAARLGVDLLKQIMTFARPTPMKKKPIDVTSTVRETLSLLRASIPSTIEIKSRFSPGSMVVMADPTQIKQVMMNLGANAAHAMKKHGGDLQVDISCVEIDDDTASKISPNLAPGSYVEVDVSDTGEGMDDKTIQHIFEPFFTTKQHGEGTGLGLAVAQEIAKGHKGAISVWSKPGKGSTFKVLLPKLEKG